jgi:two-component system, NtrC family, nitrogen regulation sensor histidine kinase NtrY
LSFRRKLFLVFALTVFVCVGAVAWTVSAMTRRAFERANEDQTAALVAQFRREFDRRGEEVAHRVEAIAGSETATRMALAVSRSPADYSVFVNEAKTLADNQQLDFLEFVDSHGTILSSAQWPAKFGYKENSLPLVSPSKGSPNKNAFLRQEEMPDSVAVSLSAMRQVEVGDNPLYVIGGRRLDKDFMRSLELAAGMRAILYPNLAKGFYPELLIAPSGKVQQAQLLAPLILQVQQQQQEATALLHWSNRAVDDESVHAIPERTGQPVAGRSAGGKHSAPLCGIAQPHSLGGPGGGKRRHYSGHRVQRMGFLPGHAAGRTTCGGGARGGSRKLEHAGSSEFV